MYRIYTTQNHNNLTLVTLLQLFQTERCTVTTFFMGTARLLKLLSLFMGNIDFHLFVSLFLLPSIILNIKNITE